MTPSLSDAPERPAAVTAALCGAVVGAASVGVLLALSDRDPGWMGVTAGIAAAASAVIGFPVRAGRTWARVVLFVLALVGVLTAHGVTVPMPAPTDLIAGALLTTLWAAVIGLLLRADVREFCAEPVSGHEKLTG
ncbi:hypothetical protein ACFQV2_36270 [Actinokineospora soli]|uniref:Tryptophan-associated transmembrane protein (Trp_oprn_chp) n=1 Tax=Actinokineospora soli TaxID=1048753 RepID=A0ABW2TWA6_9PSEU